MAYTLSKRSLAAMKGIHPDLRKVIRRALQTSRVDFTVLEGRRTPARQTELRKIGASQIADSRHLHGLAVDLGALLDGKVSWHWPLYIVLAAGMKRAAQEVGVPIVWGGDWPHLKDGGHYELPRDRYPNPDK